MNTSIGIKIFVLALLATGYVAIMGADCNYDACEGKAEGDACATTENGAVDGVCQQGVCYDACAGKSDNDACSINRATTVSDGHCVAGDCFAGVPQDNPCENKNEGDECSLPIGTGQYLHGKCVLKDGFLGCAIWIDAYDKAIHRENAEISPSREP